MIHPAQYLNKLMGQLERRVLKSQIFPRRDGQDEPKVNVNYVSLRVQQNVAIMSETTNKDVSVISEATSKTVHVTSKNKRIYLAHIISYNQHVKMDYIITHGTQPIIA